MVRTRCEVVLGVVATALLGVTLSADSVPERALAAAIRAGRQGLVDSLRATCTAKPSPQAPVLAEVNQVRRDGIYTVSISTSLGRVAVLAATAKRRGEPYGVEDVPRELRENGVYVFLNPVRPTLSGGIVSAPSPIDKVSLRSTDPESPSVSPDGVDWEGVEWRNPLGGFIEANRATAAFPWEGVRDLPPGGLVVVIAAEAGDRRCTIPAPAWRRIAAPRP